MNNRIQELIKTLGLLPHPEGGYYKEVYRAAGTIAQENLEGYAGDRNYATSIYFLLTKDNFSAFHTIKQDELWHHYEGDPVEVHCITPQGEHRVIELGKDLVNGQVPQDVVFGGEVFGSKIKEGGEYALVGCTVAPGFDFEDFELSSRASLVLQFSEHEKIITSLTRD